MYQLVTTSSFLINHSERVLIQAQGSLNWVVYGILWNSFCPMIWVEFGAEELNLGNT